MKKLAPVNLLERFVSAHLLLRRTAARPTFAERHKKKRRGNARETRGERKKKCLMCLYILSLCFFAFRLFFLESLMASVYFAVLLSNQRHLNKQLNFQDIRTNPTERLTNIDLNRTPITLLCDRMTDIKNVGAMFRIADAARLEKLFFYQSTVDFTHKKLTKVARSTNKYVEFESINSLEEVLKLTSEYEVIALDKTSESIDYNNLSLQTSKKILLIIGSERQGVSPELLQQARQSIHLPMLGVNTSMNVSVATGIAVYHLLSLVSKG